MKVFAILFVLMTSVVSAAEIKIAELPVDAFRSKARAVFAVNADLGRAWVEIEMYDQTHNRDSSSGSSWIRRKVEGLAFDANSRMVTLNVDGQNVDCASVTRRWSGTVVRNVGCSLVTKRVKVSYDDGYNTNWRWMHQVFIVTK